MAEAKKNKTNPKESPKPKEADRPTPSHKNVHVAMVEIQNEFDTIHKDQKGQDGNRSYMYADLTSIMTQIGPILHRHGCYLSQPILHDENGMIMQTILMHAESDTLIEGVVELNRPQKIKEFGAEITYIRRYCLLSLLGLVTDEDNDGDVRQKERDPEPSMISQEAQGYIEALYKAVARYELEPIWKRFHATGPSEADIFEVRSALSLRWDELKGTAKEPPQDDSTHPSTQPRESQDSQRDAQTLADVDPDEVLAEIETALEQAKDLQFVEDLKEKWAPVIAEFVAESDREMADDMFSETERMLEQAE